MTNKENARQLIQGLVDQFRHNPTQYTRSSSDYNETQLRVDFIDRFLEALGWDVYNKHNSPQNLREVMQEDTVEVEDDGELFKKNPDYALRLGGERKFFVEVKRPSTNIENSHKSAFQIRRYGWNAGLPVSLLTNFEKLIIYDCHPRPKANDDVRFARLNIYDYTEYMSKFDEIYDRFSREAMYLGQFDDAFSEIVDREATEPFDQYFLEQIERWRFLLAENLKIQNQNLTQEQLNFLVQRLLNRIIFLRICEDRELERYRALQDVQSYDDLKTLFIKADERYDSSLFDLIEGELALNVKVGSEILVTIFRELYYPESPYAFSVVEASILGEIYEQFLGKEISIENNIEIVEKPEVLVSHGVASTPKYIVDIIVQKTLNPEVNEKSPDQLANFRIIDIACGSGTFLLSAYDFLLNHYLEWYFKNQPAKYGDRVYQTAQGEWRLTLQEKQNILVTHIFGVDIDPQAVEVTKLSLLLKVLEGEQIYGVNAHLKQNKSRVLPDLRHNILCGNSLIDSSYFEYNVDAVTSIDHVGKINPLDWKQVFAKIMINGGFDVIIGNPPYIRIQRMVQYSPEEVAYYRDASIYSAAEYNNFDKYSLFIERALSLLRPTGRVGYIVPHKFFTIKSGQALRKLLSVGKHISEIVHFGVQQVFGERRATYTCILVLNKQQTSSFPVEHVTDLQTWRQGKQGGIDEYQATEIGEAPWEFISPQARTLFDRIREDNPTNLEDVAQIFVGVQTSADKIYIIHPESESDDQVIFTDIRNDSWSIERSILRPCLYDVQLPAFSRPQANCYIIFPYKIVNGRAFPYTQDEMVNYFPNCLDYLTSFRDDLKKRSIQNLTDDTWFRFGRSQSLTKFDGTSKLIWATLSTDARYAYDDQNIVFTGGGNGPYYALRPKSASMLSIYYLQAILSHPVIEAMVQARSSIFRGKYNSHGKQFIKDIPVHLIDTSSNSEIKMYEEVVRLVQQLNTATENMIRATFPQQKKTLEQQCSLIRRRIETLIEDLYNLNQQDMDAVLISTIADEVDTR